MAYTWTIAMLERNRSDDFVFRAHFNITNTENNGIFGEYVDLPRPEGTLKPFADLTEAELVEAVKANVDVSACEALAVPEPEEPVIFGVPWETSESSE